MNVDTGEIRSFAEGEPMPKSEKWAPLSIGDVVEVKGAKWRIGYINEGKQRITLERFTGGPGEVLPADLEAAAKQLTLLAKDMAEPSAE